MSDKHEVTTSEFAAPKQGKLAGIKRHFARFWWLDLLVFIALVVFLTLMTIFVAVPAIAQAKINQAELDILAVQVLNPEPDSYTMVVNSTIRTDGSVHAAIAPFDGVMYLEDHPDQAPFVTLRFPPTSGEKFQKVNVVQDAKVQNKEAFDTFNTWFVNNETLRVTVKGETSVQPRGLSKKYPVTFKKTLSLKGLNLFKGIKVIDPRAELTVDNGTDPNFRNFFAKVELPNPSHFTLQLGDAKFGNYFLGKKLGNLYIKDLVLKPGMNQVDVSASLDQGSIIVLAGSTKPYCETGIIPFSLIGEEVKFNNVSIPYFKYALEHANQTASVNITDTLVRSGIDTSIRCTSSA